MKQEHYDVVIAGAGPVGLLIAIRLGKAGIKTLVLEQHTDLLFSTRGCAYQPVVIDALQELGILDRIKEQAYLNRDGISWRDMKGNKLGLLKIPEGDYILLMGQKRLNDLLLGELEKYASVKVRFNHQYVGCEQDEKQVKVMIHQDNIGDEDDIYVTADWLVGCDGSKSAVRRSLCIPFEGKTFSDFRLVGTDVYYDFSSNGYSIMNYIRDPEDWCGMLFTGERRREDGAPLWRVAYPEPAGLSLKQEDVLARAQKRLAHYAPQHANFDIKRAEPYKIQQRCAAQATKGRVLLAGDALHSNNPAGGYGLTTGILDACLIGKVMAQVCLGQAPKSLLIETANDRRETWLNVTNKISLAMFKRLSSFEPDDVQMCKEFFHGLTTDESYSAKAWARVGEIAGSRAVAAN